MGGCGDVVVDGGLGARAAGWVPVLVGAGRLPVLVLVVVCWVGVVQVWCECGVC